MLATRNKKIALILLVFSIVYTFFSFRLPSYDLVPVDADAVPITLGILLMILSVILFFIKSNEEDEKQQQRVIPEDKKDLIMLFVVALFILGYIWLLERAGFIITSVLFIFVTTLILGYKRHIVNLVVSLAVPVGFYFIFSSILEISLPKGFLPF